MAPAAARAEMSSPPFHRWCASTRLRRRRSQISNISEVRAERRYLNARSAAHLHTHTHTQHP